MYKELVNVANGTLKQLDACISALDLHDNPPAEIDTLLDQLESARQTCETIISKGEDEPETQPTTTDAKAAVDQPSGEAETPPTAGEKAAQEETEKLKSTNVFEDKQA